MILIISCVVFVFSAVADPIVCILVCLQLFSQREPSDAIAIEHCWFEQDEIQGEKVHYRSKPVYYQFLQLVLIYLTNR